jgi:phospholipid/cholesterol/gamma-HCH transport system permease protein
MQAQVELGDDVMSGIIKSFFFGVTASLLAVFEGYNCVPTAEGVGQATTRAVVYTSLAVLALNFMLTAWLLGGN